MPGIQSSDGRNQQDPGQSGGCCCGTAALYGQADRGGCFPGDPQRKAGSECRFYDQRKAYLCYRRCGFQDTACSCGYGTGNLCGGDDCRTAAQYPARGSAQWDVCISSHCTQLYLHRTGDCHCGDHRTDSQHLGHEGALWCLRYE